MGRISTSSRYVIDIIRMDLHSLGELGGGDFQCFGQFGASGRAKMANIGRRVRNLQKLT